MAAAGCLFTVGEHESWAVVAAGKVHVAVQLSAQDMHTPQGVWLWEYGLLAIEGFASS